MANGKRHGIAGWFENLILGQYRKPSNPNPSSQPEALPWKGPPKKPGGILGWFFGR